MRFLLLALAALVASLSPRAAQAGCGCDKPPPPRAWVRPFVAHVDQTITIFDDDLVPGEHYVVQFTSTTDWSVDWSLGKAVLAHDLADGKRRPQIRVTVGNVGLGPCALTVWSGNVAVATLGDALFTVTAPPLALYDFQAKFVRHGYRTAVGRDGTLYVAVDVGTATAATTFHALATGLPVRFTPSDVSIYNAQGFLMQVLDPSAWTQAGNALHELVAERNAAALLDVPFDLLSLLDPTASSVLTYWRHEFATYKDDHRKLPSLEPAHDPSWHVDRTAHVDHDHLVVAIKGRLVTGAALTPGTTPPFTLTFVSVPDDPNLDLPLIPEGEVAVAAVLPDASDGGDASAGGGSAGGGGTGAGGGVVAEPSDDGTAVGPSDEPPPACEDKRRRRGKKAKAKRHRR